MDGAVQGFETRFKHKSGLDWDSWNESPKAGKYPYIEKNYESADEAEDGQLEDVKIDTLKSKVPRPTQRLIELILLRIISTPSSRILDTTPTNCR